MTSARAGFGTLLKMGDGGESPTAGGGSTTTDAAVAAGATVIPVADPDTGFTAGDLILIGGAGGEIREIASIQAGVSLTVTVAVDFSHASGSTVVEVDPQEFTTIAEVLDIQLPQLATDMQDVTNHSSPGAYEEQIPVILRTGNVQFDVNLNLQDPTHDEDSGLLYVWRNRYRRSFQVVFPGGQDTWEFSGYVTSFQPNAPVAGVLRASIGIKVLGALDYDAAA